MLVINKEAAGFWGDERHFEQLKATLEESKQKNNYMLVVQSLFLLNARPGIGLFYYPPAYLEWKDPSVPYGMYFNLLVNTLGLILIYFITKKTYGEKAAFITTLFVTLSMSSLVYVRHLIPYDIALLPLLLGLYIHLYFKKNFIFGILAGLTFLTYPGYYYYLIPLPILFFLYYRDLKKTSLFVMGIGTILLFTQLTSMALSKTANYFDSIRVESAGGATEHYGEFMPVVSFVGEYIFTTDGIWGILLVFYISGVLLIKSRKKFLLILVYLLSIFLILEICSHILEKTVLFARTARPFYIMLLVLSGVTLERILSEFSSKKIYIAGMSIFILITFINWLPRFLLYKDLTYPKQFKQEAKDYLDLKFDNYKLTDNAVFVNYWDVGQVVPEHFFNPEKGTEGEFYILNAVQMFPYYGNYELNNFCKAQVLLKESHAQNVFRPYLFEGHKRKMREKMDQDPLYYQLIYCQS